MFFQMAGQVAASLDEVDGVQALMRWNGAKARLPAFARRSFSMAFLGQLAAKRAAGGAP